MRLVGVGSKPAQAATHSLVIAGASLAQRLLTFRIVAQAGRSVQDRREHSLAKLWEHGSNCEGPANARGKVADRRAGLGILQVIYCSAVGDGGNDRGELQRRDSYAFAEAAHACDASATRRRGGKKPGLLATNVKTSALAEAEDMVVMPHRVESETASQLLEEVIVRVGEGFGHVHVTALSDANHRIGSDDSVFERSNGNYGLGCRAGFETSRVGELLVDNGKDTASRWVLGNHGAVLASERVEGSLTDDWIVEPRIVPRGRIGHVRGNAAIAVVAASTRGMGGAPVRRAPAAHVRRHHNKRKCDRDCQQKQLRNQRAGRGDVSGWGSDHGVFFGTEC